MSAIFAVQRAGDRAHSDHGWLDTYHSFSFAEYHDPKNEHWGALRVLNDDRVAPGQGFGTHGHRDMEIVTYVLEGELEHRDSMGNHGVVHPGGVQYMSAGTGVRHSEYNGSVTKWLHFVQMWVLPSKTGVAPSYGQHEFPAVERHDAWLAVASGESGVPSPVRLMRDATLFASSLERASLEHAFAPGRLGFFFAASGTVTVESDAGSADLIAGDAIRLAGVDRIATRGSGEVLLWDLPEA